MGSSVPRQLFALPSHSVPDKPNQAHLPSTKCSLSIPLACLSASSVSVVKAPSKPELRCGFCLLRRACRSSHYLQPYRQNQATLSAVHPPKRPGSRGKLLLHHLFLTPSQLSTSPIFSLHQRNNLRARQILSIRRRLHLESSKSRSADWYLFLLPRSTLRYLGSSATRTSAWRSHRVNRCDV